MAQAIKRLYKNVKLGVGPVIENGFYYDVDMEEALTPEDLPKIEKEMKKIVGENLPIVRKEVSREEARARFAEIGDDLKWNCLMRFRKVKRYRSMNKANSSICAAVFTFLRQEKSRSSNC